MSYKGNQIGISKVEGILTQKTNLKDWKYRDFLPGPEPFVTKDIEDDHKNLLDKKWYERYADSSGLAVERRVDDAVRIAKFIASGRGILWESKMTGLETIQKELTKKSLQNYKDIRSEAPENSSFWKKVGSILSSAGKSVLSNIALTAATLTQTTLSGTGYHGDTYASRAYLRRGTGSSILVNLLASIGIVNGDYLVGATYVQKGQNIPISGDSVSSDRKFIPTTDPALEIHQNRVNQLDPVPEKKKYGIDTPLTGVGTQGITGSNAPLGKTVNPLGTPQSVTFDNRANSEVRDKDLKDLGNRYGEVKGTREYKTDPSKVSSKFDSEGAKFLKDSDIHHNLDGSRRYIGATGGRVSATSSSRFISEESASYNWTKTAKVLEGTVETVEDGQFTSNTVKGRTANITLHAAPEDKRNYAAQDTIQSYFYHINLNKTGGKGGIVTETISDENAKHLEESLGLTPFCISTVTPDWRTYINFPINLESYDDNYNGNWEAVQYVGRGENFYGYSGFTRNINFSFKVVALHPRDLLELYRRLNRLVGATAPSYDSTGLFMRGTLSCITLGDLLVEQFGFISNVKLTWQKDYLWIPGANKDGNDETGWEREAIMLPEVLDVSVAFTPIERSAVKESHRAFFVFKPKKIGVVTVGEVTSSSLPESNEASKSTFDRSTLNTGSLLPQVDNTLVSYNPLSGNGNIRGSVQKPLDSLAIPSYNGGGSGIGSR